MGMVFCPTNYEANMGLGFSLIFKSWVISDSKSYALACVGVFAMGVVRQLISCLRGHLPALRRRAPGGNAAFGNVQAYDSRESLIPAQAPAAGLLGSLDALFARYPLLLLALDTLLYAASLLLAYLNMLVAMAYDAGLLTSLVAGEALTYFGVRAVALFTGSSRLLGKSEASGGGAEACCATE
jgi:hypothetical protein